MELTAIGRPGKPKRPIHVAFTGRPCAGFGVAVGLDGRQLVVTFRKATPGDVTVRVSGLGGPARTIAVRQGSASVRVEPRHGWYDIAVTLDRDAAYRRRFAGHVENGKPGVTG